MTGDYEQRTKVIRAITDYVNSDGKPYQLENKIWRIRYWFHAYVNRKSVRMSYREWRRHMKYCGYHYLSFLWVNASHPDYLKRSIDDFFDVAIKALNRDRFLEKV